MDTHSVKRKRSKSPAESSGAPQIDGSGSESLETNPLQTNPISTNPIKHNDRKTGSSDGRDTIDRTSNATTLSGIAWSPITFLIVLSVAIALAFLISTHIGERAKTTSSIYENVILSFDEDHASAQTQLKNAVEQINGGDRNGFGILDVQKGIFRLLGASAYRVFRIGYAADFHSQKKRAYNYPYLLSNYVKFVRVVMNVYKALKVIPDSEHAPLDELVQIMDEMEKKLRSKGCGNILRTNGPDDARNGDDSSAGGKQDSQKYSQGLDYLNRLEQVLLDAQLEGESITDFESRPHCTVPVRFWYENFMPKLLEVCSIGAPDQNIVSEAALEEWFHEERARLIRGKANDVLEAWKGCSTKVKLSIKRAWRLVRHYMLGPQKQRERDSESHADHRSTGDLTRYVAFLDVYLGRSYVEEKKMRVTFPYLIGPSTWNLHHLIAERACDHDLTPEMKSVIVEEFRDYFALFATVYPCPYCRHHFNEYVNRNKELNDYPMEFVVLGLDHARANNRSHAFAFGDKLSAVTDGPSLRLFVWKLHNAVSASISRSESWYNEARSITTSRYWPNIHAEIYRGKTGSGAVSADRMLKIIKVIEVAADLEGLRKKYITNETESEEKHGAEGGDHGNDVWRISDVDGLLEEAAPLVRQLDATMDREGLLQESYWFHGHLDGEFTVDHGGEMVRVYSTPYMRNEHYTVR